MVSEQFENLLWRVVDQVLLCTATLRRHAFPAEALPTLIATRVGTCQLAYAVSTRLLVLVAWLKVAASVATTAARAVEVLRYCPHLPVDLLPAELFLPQEHHEVVQFPSVGPNMRLLSFSSKVYVSMVWLGTLNNLKLRLSQNHVAVFTHKKQVFSVFKENLQFLFVNSWENDVFLVMHFV